MKKQNLMTLVMLLLANVFVTVSSSATNTNLNAGLNSPTSIKTVNTDQNALDSAVIEGSVPITFENDSVYPWYYENGYIISGNKYVSYTNSTLKLSFESTYKTYISFKIGLSGNISNSIFIDGAETYTSSFPLLLDKGKHIVEIKAETGFSGYIKLFDINVQKIRPLEDELLTKASEKITFVNDEEKPWFADNGYIINRHNNSSFSTTFTINKPSKLSFTTRLVDYKSYDNNTNSHKLEITINGYKYSTIHKGGIPYEHMDTITVETKVFLEPGEYNIKWTDSNGSYSYLETQISNVELSSNWVEVNAATPGTLGTELIKNVKDLNGIELLKVCGSINQIDWRDIKHLYNLIALDLSEAKVDEVPDYAFDGLKYISDVKLPEGVKRIGLKSFFGTEIYTITIPSSVETISTGAFRGTRLRKINFRENSKLKLIEAESFYSCNRLEEFIMPNSVKSLGTSVFRFSGIKKIVFSDSLTTIPEYTCQECELEEIKLPKNLETIGSYCFNYNQNLKKVKFPNSLRTIDNYAFNSCDLDSVSFPIKMGYLHYGVFDYNHNLKYIELPSNMGGFSSDAFNWCNNIEKIVCRSATPPAIDYDPFSSASKSAVTLVVPSFAVNSYKLDTYWYQYINIVPEDMELDYWNINGKITLTDDCRILGTPDIDIVQNGELIVEGNAPMNIKNLSMQGGKLTSNGNSNYNISSLNISMGANFTTNGNSKIDIKDLQVGQDARYSSNGNGSVTVKNLSIGNHSIFSSLGNNTLTIDTLKIDYNGKLELGGNKPANLKNISIYTSPGRYYYYDSWNQYETEPTCIINNCTSVTADSIKTILNVNGNRWYFFCPTHDVDLSKVYHTNVASCVFRYYDGNNRASSGMGYSWQDVNDGKLSAGQGYILQCSSDGEIVMPVPTDKYAQVLSCKDIIKPLAQYKSDNIVDESWNFVGNPYPACFNIKNMDFSAPITVWTGNTYRAYSITDDNYVLYPNEGFFVQKPNETDSIVFHKEGRMMDKELKQTEENMAFATEKPDRFLFNINMTNENGISDVTRVVLNDKASLDYEISCDASKFMSMDKNVPQIYTLDNKNNSYAINERPENNDEVVLGYTASAGKYTISATRADGIVTLTDKKLDKTVVLSDEDYTFVSDGTNGSDNGRFVLKFRAGGESTGIIDAQNVSSGVTATDNGISISNNGCTEYKIYTLDGKMVKVGKTQQNETTVQLPADTYIVKMNGSVYKVIVL